MKHADSAKITREYTEANLGIEFDDLDRRYRKRADFIRDNVPLTHATIVLLKLAAANDSVALAELMDWLTDENDAELLAAVFDVGQMVYALAECRFEQKVKRAHDGA